MTAFIRLFFDELCFQVHDENNFHRNSKEIMFPVFSSVARTTCFQVHDENNFHRNSKEILRDSYSLAETHHDPDQGIRHVSDSLGSETNVCFSTEIHGGMKSTNWQNVVENTVYSIELKIVKTNTKCYGYNFRYQLQN